MYIVDSMMNVLAKTQKVFQLKLKKWLPTLCPYNMFLSLFAMNQRYDCLRRMKALAII